MAGPATPAAPSKLKNKTLKVSKNKFKKFFVEIVTCMNFGDYKLNPLFLERVQKSCDEVKQRNMSNYVF